MGKFKHIEWDKKYSVHVEIIDTQHQELFSIVNRIIDLYESGSNEYYPELRDRMHEKNSNVPPPDSISCLQDSLTVGNHSN